MSIARHWNLLKLKLRATILQAEAEHAEGLLADHARRYRNTLGELQQVRNRIMALESPEVLLSKIARSA